jgi:anti-sigma regulatory factor (Ser/Thr protein kinase)
MYSDYLTSGLGFGLAGVKQLMDELEIVSEGDCQGHGSGSGEHAVD